MVQSPGVVEHLSTRLELGAAPWAGVATQAVVRFPEVLLEWLACCERCPTDWAPPNLFLICQLIRLVELNLKLAPLPLDRDHLTSRDQAGAIVLWSAEFGPRRARRMIERWCEEGV